MQRAAFSLRESPSRSGYTDTATPLSPVSRCDDRLRVGLELSRERYLIGQAEAAGFDVLVTTDKNWKHQQNLGGRRLAVVVLLSTSWPKIQLKVSAVVVAVEEATIGSYVEVEI